MRIGVLRERAAGERRVALIPDGVARLAKAGHEIRVESAAGIAAGFPDEKYAAAGATIVPDAASAADAELVLAVRRPSMEQVALLKEGSLLVALLQPATAGDLSVALRERSVKALSLEKVPRITKAQSMDVLSSQSTVAGYKAALIGAAQLVKFLPMLTTAAGTIAPARAFVLGAGVAGLQAIATTRRLGAIVSAFDIRPAAAEQVQSLGASFVSSEAVAQSAETAGGYARQQTEDEHSRTLATIGKHIADQDLVITTALIPGRPAPRLITGEMVHSMRPGSVIVDIAAEAGGNCELTEPDETVAVNGVTILGPTNLPSTVPLHASQMFSRNLETLIKHLAPEGALALDEQDEIVSAMLLSAPSS
ncbi:MAG TPA: Re/Si-specific NAD(P)(+) transhydrogenase subunit alpha [Gemmatimonadaceae bacterium]|nr:Re/Si-specific NAD(P)(+) transhydrogenase subunit alpha [Gemmatimonadaceae bacterium]